MSRSKLKKLISLFAALSISASLTIGAAAENGADSTDITFADGAAYTLEDGCITGVATETSMEEFKTHFASDIIVKDADGIDMQDGLVCTGFTVTQGTAKALVAVGGDTDGNGKTDATDYIIVKRHFLKISTLSGAYFKAADMDGTGVIDSTDYIAIKRIILGIKPGGEQKELPLYKGLVYLGDTAESSVRYNAGDALYTPVTPEPSHDPSDKTKKLKVGSYEFTLSYVESNAISFRDHLYDLYSDSAETLAAIYPQNGGNFELLVFYDYVYRAVSSITSSRSLTSVTDHLISGWVGDAGKYEKSIETMKAKIVGNTYEIITVDGFTAATSSTETPIGYIVYYKYVKDGVETGDTVSVALTSDGYLISVSLEYIGMFDDVPVTEIDFEKCDKIVDETVNALCADTGYSFKGYESSRSLIIENGYCCALYYVEPSFGGSLPADFYAAPFGVIVPVLKLK